MPELTLIYFNGRGRAELARWILAYGSIPYTDDRIEKADWPARKPHIFSGKVPVLMVDGKPLPQSLAIARYLARLADLVPQDHYQAAFIDGLGDKINEVNTKTNMILRETTDEKEKKEQLAKYRTEVINPFLGRLSKLLEGHEWFISAKMTWGDLMIGQAMTGLSVKLPNLLDDYPNVKRLVDKVLAIPKIKEWNDKQPEMDF